MQRFAGALVAVVVAVFIGVVATPAAASADVACAERPGVSWCDSDVDRIADTVEVLVCGSATCATGREDRDGDGVPDWSELVACGTTRCAAPAVDGDGDGIPDYAEQFVCGDQHCSGGLEDRDDDGVGDWVEFVICGDRWCANGSEDYDADGISDAKQLTACVVRFGVTTAAGATWAGWPRFVVTVEVAGERVEIVVWWPLIVGILVAALGVGAAVGVMLWRRRQPDAAAASEVDDELEDALP